MGDKIDIYKITLDFLKGNKVLLLLVTTALAGTGAQTFRLDNAEKEKIKAVREVAAGFQSVMIGEIPKTPSSSCDKCTKQVEQLKIDINKLKRWH